MITTTTQFVEMERGAIRLTFIQSGLLDNREAASSAALDVMAFGGIGISPDGIVISYSAAEIQRAGLAIGRGPRADLFSSVAPYTEDDMLKVRLRLPKTTRRSHAVLAIERR